MTEQIETETFRVRVDDKGGYIINISIGKSPFHAETFEEIVIALEHYLKPTKEMQVHPHQYNEDNRVCPICRVMWLKPEFREKQRIRT